MYKQFCWIPDKWAGPVRLLAQEATQPKVEGRQIMASPGAVGPGTKKWTEQGALCHWPEMYNPQADLSESNVLFRASKKEL